MKRTALVITVSLLVGVIAGSFGTRLLHAQQPGITRTPLMQKDLMDLPGKELVMYSVEIAPGGQSGRHYHPGHEIAYVLSGSGALEVDGQPALDVKPGSSFHIPPKQIHNGKTVGSMPLKVLVVTIHPKGEPPVFPVQ